MALSSRCLQIDVGDQGDSFAFIYSIEDPKAVSPRQGVGAQVTPTAKWELPGILEIYRRVIVHSSTSHCANRARPAAMAEISEPADHGPRGLIHTAILQEYSKLLGHAI